MGWRTLGVRPTELGLGDHRRQVAIQRLFQQALLLSVLGLALRHELQPLEGRVVVRELVDDGSPELNLDARNTRCLAQSFRIQCGEIVGDHRL